MATAMWSQTNKASAMEPKLQRQERGGIFRELKRNRALYGMAAPALIVLFFNNYLPMFGIIIAFKDYNFAKGIFGSEWAGLKNFEFLFSTPDAWVITRNTVFFNLLFIAVGVVVAVSLAIALNELLNKRLAKLYQTILLLPHFLSWVVVAYLGLAFMNAEFGYLNRQILPLLGMEPVIWYAESSKWLGIFPLVHLWKTAGYSLIVYLAAITAIDSEFYEAAIISGATKWQQILHITIPIIKPVIVILIIMQLGQVFRADFGLFYQFTLDSPMIRDVANVIDSYVFRGLMQMNDYGMSSAAGLYQSVVGFFFVLTANYVVRKIGDDLALF